MPTGLRCKGRVPIRVNDLLIDDCSLCGRILFRDGDYTNINWIGLWVTITALLSISVASLAVTWSKELVCVIKEVRLWIGGVLKALTTMNAGCVTLYGQVRLDKQRVVWSRLGQGVRHTNYREDDIAVDADVELQQRAARMVLDNDHDDIARVVHMDDPLP